MLEMAETFVHDPAVRRTGVFPRGAQVLAMVGTRRNPVSSRKAKWAPSRAVFFYSGPDLLLPVPDRGFVTFSGPFIRFLATPPQALHQFPDIRNRVPDTELTANDLPDALQVHRSVINPASMGPSLRIRSRHSFWRRLSREGRPGDARGRSPGLPSLRNAWCHRTTELSDAPVCMATAR
jgi:hypothetical protein